MDRSPGQISRSRLAPSVSVLRPCEIVALAYHGVVAGSVMLAVSSIVSMKGSALPVVGSIVHSCVVDVGVGFHPWCIQEVYSACNRNDSLW